jgi:UDP-N-acetyl-D-galactosamine dehydrogenase
VLTRYAPASAQPQSATHAAHPRLADYGIQTDVHDPLADPAEARREYGLDLVAQPRTGEYDGVVLAVAHQPFRELGAERIRALGKPLHVLYDLKYVLTREEADLRL